MEGDSFRRVSRLMWTRIRSHAAIMSKESGCCQSLSTCCSEASDSAPAGLVNTALSDAPTAACTRQTSSETQPKDARTALVTPEPFERRQTRRTTAAPAKESTGLKFGWVKKLFHTPPVPLVTRSGGSRISASAYRAGPKGGRCRKQRRRRPFLFGRLLPSFVVLLS